MYLPVARVHAHVTHRQGPWFRGLRALRPCVRVGACYEWIQCIMEFSLECTTPAARQGTCSLSTPQNSPKWMLR